MAAPGPLARTPYFSFGRRPYREERLAAYIRREHARGRHVRSILRDPYVERYGGAGVLRAVLQRRDMIETLGHDVVTAIHEAGQSTSIASPKE